MAQTQERKLMDRMLKPDMQLGTPFQNQAFKGGSSMLVRSSPVADKNFLDSKGASIKEFSSTHSFLGLKNPWLGHQVYDTKNASVWSRSVALDAGKKMPVRRAETVTAADAAKTASLGSPVVPVRPFTPVPSSQGALSQITDKIKNNMTIDEVRDLLNKPR